MKKIISIIIAIFLIGQTAFAIDYGAEYENQPEKEYLQTFKDVKQTYWAFDFISEMTERGVINGYPNGFFYPENSVTRAEFAKIMTVAAGLSVSKPQQKIFRDVDINEWYAPFIHTAYNYLSGFNYADGMYYLPETNALREDIAVALVKLKGYDTTGADVSMLKAMFTDWASISESAKIYVATALEKGLISGYSDNTFRGQNTITRAEAATLLWRAFQYGNENKSFDVSDKQITLTKDNNYTEPEIEKPTEKQQETTEVKQKKTAALTTVLSDKIRYFVPVSEKESFIFTENNEIYFCNNSDCKKICSASDFPQEYENDDTYYQIPKYSGQMAFPRAKGNKIEFDISTVLNLDGHQTVSQATFCVDKAGNAEISVIYPPFDGKPYYYFEGLETDDRYETIPRATTKFNDKEYTYIADKNVILSKDYISGGTIETKVKTGIPIKRTIGITENGFAVFADNNFYKVNLDGTWNEFFNIDDYDVTSTDNSIYNDISSFYIIGNTAFIISANRNSAKILTF